MDDQVSALVSLLPETWGAPAATAPDREPAITVKFVNAEPLRQTWIDNLLASLGIVDVVAYTVTVEDREVTPRKKAPVTFPVATISVWVAP